MNELDGMLDTLKTPEPTQKKSWIHALPHEWLKLEEHEGNCDELPAWLTPKTGCPKCGAAWLSVEQVAFGSTCHRGRLAVAPYTRGFEVMQIGGIEPPMAVRLFCAGDHLVEFDGYVLTVIELPNWGILALGMLGVPVMGLYGRAVAAARAP